MLNVLDLPVKALPFIVVLADKNKLDVVCGVLYLKVPFNTPLKLKLDELEN